MAARARADCDDGDKDAMWELEEGEWGLAIRDKAYCGIKQMLYMCGNKPEEAEFGAFWNSFISSYRGCVRPRA